MANYLNVRGFMEMTGRGSVLIQESCRANGLPEPQWTADENSVTLTFTAKSGMSRQVAQDGGVEKGKEKGREKSKEKSKEKILALLSVNPHATTADLIAETGLSVSGVEKNIRELKAAGRLMYTYYVYVYIYIYTIRNPKKVEVRVSVLTRGAIGKW